MRKDEDPDDEPDLDARFELDAEALTRGRQGRCGWFREGRRQLDEHREQEARPVARSRSDRLEDAKRRLEEQLAVELAANQAYETYRRTGRDTTGRRVGGGTKPYDTPVLPEGRVNLTDPDSRLMRTQGQPTLQGYNAQAAVTAEQIIVAAEPAIESPDFGHLEPMFNAAMCDLVLAGVNERPGTPLADAGYWHELQMESIVAGGTQVLVPPDSSLKEQPRAGWTGGLYDHMRRVLLSDTARRSTDNASKRSSRCSDTPNTTARSTASNDAAEPPRSLNGG